MLFTGRFPRGAFDYLVGVQRWAYRVSAYHLFMTDAYPPFSLEDDPDDPIRLVVEYPEHIANWRPLVHWLLVFPYAIVSSILFYLTLILAFFAFFTVLFTKRIPRGMFDLMVPASAGTARERLRVLDDRPVPAVHLGLGARPRTPTAPGGASSRPAW